MLFDFIVNRPLAYLRIKKAIAIATTLTVSNIISSCEMWTDGAEVGGKSILKA